MSTAAALNGSIAAFDGRILHVRSAGEDAWLCKEAPLSVEHDFEDPEERKAIHASEDMDLWAGAKAVADGNLQVRGYVHCFARRWLKALLLQVAVAKHDDESARRNAEIALTKPLSFRSMTDAMAAARDGDRIVVQLGQHNMGGSALKVDKRVLIRYVTHAIALRHSRHV